MNKKEEIHVLEMMQDFYPKYNLSKEKAKMLIPALLPMEYERVMEKLAAFVASHPYAPTIAEIAAYPPVRNEQLDEVSVWKKEAANVPEEIKRVFHLKMSELLQDKAYAND